MRNFVLRCWCIDTSNDIEKLKKYGVFVPSIVTAKPEMRVLLLSGQGIN
jgi:hypothetical protein